jgi:large subunit ribosomal protein L4
MQLGALRSALSVKLRDGELKVVSAFDLNDAKTATVAAALERLEAGRKVLLVENGDNRNLTLGSRNLPGVTLLPSRDVHVYHLLGHDRVLISQAAALKLSEALQ